MSGAGQRNRRVTFEERAEIVAAPVAPDPLADDPLATPGGDALGDPYAWGTRFDRWASVTPAKSLDEGERGHAVTAVGRFDLRVLHDPETAAIAPETWRVRLDGETYDIRSAEDPDGTRRVLEMRLEKGGGP